MISDQIFFKKVNEVEKVQHVNVTLDKAAAKQIDNYTSQQVSNKTIMHGDASASEIKGAMDSSKFIDDDKQKYQFLDLSKYQGLIKSYQTYVVRSTYIIETY